MRQDGQYQKSNLVLVAVGSNSTSYAGNSFETVQAAFAQIGRKWTGFQVSHYYQTPAFPAGAGPDFVNAACAFYSDDSPDAVLNALHDIEAQFGRERQTRWGQRTLDLDLIAHGDAVLPDWTTFDHWHDLPLSTQTTTAPDRLILPHPRVQDRSFVLMPLADIAPDWVHPRRGETVAQMLNNRPQSERDTVVHLTT